ncbi:PD-(D/E)XK nuclease family protein [Halocalculus aciditolerans]|uniref:ATP-dependent helicase/nuclease subunit B n=1 Tax=Halocalculus aciditolerans TaxID=1383812 RepID=A0A830F8D2_9EURY|nr:hypothetical protein [Halocalculus aciditolerans]GGL73307.1 hypothetical protein GCM10009039_34280 [Halocalculus aciditolerans]
MKDRVALAGPLDAPDVPVVEVVSRTRRAEARAAMAVVDALCADGVPVRDVAVVTRDLDGYEEALSRAAVQYGLAPAFWTQLRVTRTRPFALLVAVCDALDADRLDAATLLRPLERRWAPAERASGEWPVPPRVTRAAARDLPAGERTPAEWADEIGESSVDSRVRRFAAWLAGQPAPTPERVGDVLGGVVDAYEAVGVPATKASDSPALLETETDARAVVRLRTLVEQVGYKYADRLDEGTLERSWSAVAELARLIATQRPGRREHSHALAVDVSEANDVWALDVPYVVAVGLVDGEWPRRADSPLPLELRDAVLDGSGDTASLAPRTAWTDGRDRDQFADTLAAAGEALVVTRHAESVDGDARHPSPLLAGVDREALSESERRRLVSRDRVLPAALERVRERATDEGEGS